MKQKILERLGYSNRIERMFGRGMMIALTGQRRVGKSCVMRRIYNHIAENEENLITAKPKAHAFKNEMCFPLTKTKCELKKHPNSKFECFFNDFNRTRTSLFLPFPSKLIQDNLVCVLELQE